MDPFTLIIIAIIVIFFFPLIMRGVGCLIRVIATVVIIAAAFALLSQLL